MTVLHDDPHTDPPFQPQEAAESNEVGYKKPPKHSQFAKGKSGNPRGRPKGPVGISIKELLDGDQRVANGAVISRRKAYVITVVNEALRGNQKAFSKFMKLMHRSGLMRQEKRNNPIAIQVPARPGTREDFMHELPPS